MLTGLEVQLSEVTEGPLWEVGNSTQFGGGSVAESAESDGSQAAGRLRSASAMLKPAALIIARSVLSLGLPRSDSAR